MDAIQKIIIAFELHDVASIKEGFRNGVNPNRFHKGKPQLGSSTSSGYLRNTKIANFAGEL